MRDCSNTLQASKIKHKNVILGTTFAANIASLTSGKQQKVVNMLKITSKHLEVTAPIRERVESRFAKLERYDIQLINPHVIIIEEKPLFKIEATVKVPQGELFAQAKHENLYNAINAMGQKLEKQLNSPGP